MKTLGIIGGLGPMASAYLLQLVTEMTDAKTDQEHLEVFLYSHPATPDRTAYILDRTKPSPLPELQRAARMLEKMGAQVLCAPCVTSHFFYGELQKSVGVPILNMPEETARELASAGKKRVGIMATTGTVSTGLFQSACGSVGVETLLPSKEGQSLVMSLIYDDIKAGRPADRSKLNRVLNELFGAGCDCVVLGCTELSLIKKELGLDRRCLDALEVLSKRAVEACGAPLKRQYERLVD